MVGQLMAWCRDKNLCINVKKTKEMIVDLKKATRNHPPPLYIGGAEVEVDSSFKFLGVHINDNLTWKTNCRGLVKKTHQWLYFLRRLKQGDFYKGVVESASSPCVLQCGMGTALFQIGRPCSMWLRWQRRLLDAVSRWSVTHTSADAGVGLPAL
jgi:hypothetical protein